jgi:hypothetical protein
MLPSINALWNSVWGDSTLTPSQTCANLGTGGVTAFTAYSTLSTFIATESASVGVDLSYIYPGKTGAIVAPPVPAGWTYSSTDGATITVTPPPPITPANLAATAVTTLPGQASLSWLPVTGALGYTIQRSQDGGSTFQEVVHGRPIVALKTTGGGQVVISPAPTSWIDVDDVAAGTQYRIYALTPAGVSAVSAPVTL